MDVIVTKDNLDQAAAKPAKDGDFHPETTTKPAASPVDTDVARVLKMVPGEVAALYTAMLALVASSASGSGDSTTKYAAPIAIVLCCIMIVMWIRRSGERHTPPVTPHPTQYIVTVLAFLAWAFSIRNPLEGFGREVPSWISGFSIIVLPIFGGLFLRDRPKPAKEA